MFAYNGAQMISIAQPFIGDIYTVENEFLRINIRKRNLIMTFVAIGLSLRKISISFTFIDTNILSFVSSYLSLTFLIKSGVRW